MALTLENIKRLDLGDVVRNLLISAGFNKVFLHPPDASKHQESIAIRFGVPNENDCYFDFSFESTIRITLFINRINDLDAMADAQVIESALRNGSLISQNGSYEFVSCEVEKARPVQWDESGKEIWVVEAKVHIKENN